MVHVLKNTPICINKCCNHILPTEYTSQIDYLYAVRIFMYFLDTKQNTN